jgi:phosphatidylcholine synthase
MEARPGTSGSSEPASLVRRSAGWLIHVYTASGALLGLLALQAVARRDPRQALLWMAAAVFVDSTDGWMARRLEVRRLIPSIDGRRLDDIVDYFTYVVVPVAFLFHLGLIPETAGLAALPLVASGLGFANERAKTPDDFFLGFPSYWNVVALYLWWLHLDPVANGAIVAVLSALVLVPIRFLYPSKTRPLRPWTLALGSLWGLQVAVALFGPQAASGWWTTGSLWFPAYYFGASVWLHVHLPPSPPAGQR